MSRLSSYSDFIDAYKSLARTDEIDSSDEVLISSSFRRNLKYALHAGEWPEHLIIEQRTFDSNGVIPFSQTGKEDIDELWSCYITDPTSLPTPKPIKVVPISTGWKPIYSTTATSLYVKYLPVYTKWDGDDYSSTTTYAIGDVVLYGSDFYECIASSTGNAPTNTSYWELKQFSTRILDFLAQACYTDILLGEDKDAWAAGMQRAYSYLSSEQFIISRNNAFLNPRIQTNNNQQHRR